MDLGSTIAARDLVERLPLTEVSICGCARRVVRGVAYACLRCEVCRLDLVWLYWLNFALTSLSMPWISCVSHQYVCPLWDGTLSHFLQRIDEIGNGFVCPVFDLVPLE